MHYTLHLTDACNMGCTYCYVPPGTRVMSRQVAFAAVDKAGEGPERGALVFFGGEPLLQRALIEETVAYARIRAEQNVRGFHFKLTTNGLLLDDTFLDLAQRESILVALSLDGVAEAHDAHRRDAAGEGTHARVCDAAVRLLARKPYAPALITVNPDTAPHFARGVRFCTTWASPTLSPRSTMPLPGRLPTCACCGAPMRSSPSCTTKRPWLRTSSTSALSK